MTDYLTDTNVPNYEIKRMIKSLEEAIDVCYNAKSIDPADPNNVDDSYPFATGYSRSCMQSVLQTLETYVNED